MKPLSLPGTSGFFVEIGNSSVAVRAQNAGLDLLLDREPDGRLSQACRERLVPELEAFFRKNSWQPRPSVVCAIPARGVSLRRLRLPVANTENLQRLLLLQIENEFPLAPAELAWGCRPDGKPKPPQNGSPGEQEWIVAAVKRELVEPYAELLSACGAHARFTVAALARQQLCPAPGPNDALLDIGRVQSELVCFENSRPLSIRILPWGGESLTRAIEQKTGLTFEQAEKLKLQWADAPSADAELRGRIESAIEGALDSLAAALTSQPVGRTLYLTGRTTRLGELAPGLARRLPTGTNCQSLEPASLPGSSAAISGLQKVADKGAPAGPLFLQVKQANGRAALDRPAPWKWIGIAASLMLALLVLPYLEAVVLKPVLARKLAALKADRGRLAMIDSEWSFLQFLKQNQSPYLDTLYLLAKSSPPGARIDSLIMNRRGELSWRGTMQNSQQLGDFRSKLVDSGFFSAVTVEEQTPSPDRQKLSVRMIAQVKPSAARQTLAFGPTADEIEKAKTRSRDIQPGAMPIMPPMGVPMPEAGPPPRPVPSRPGSPAGSPAPGGAVRGAIRGQPAGAEAGATPVPPEPLPTTPPPN